MNPSGEIVFLVVKFLKGFPAYIGKHSKKFRGVLYGDEMQFIIHQNHLELLCFHLGSHLFRQEYLTECINFYQDSLFYHISGNW